MGLSAVLMMEKFLGKGGEIHKKYVEKFVRLIDQEYLSVLFIQY